MTSRAQQATRRGFLASLAAGAGVFGVGRASAAREDYETVRADHVSIRYDAAELERYRPYLDFPAEMSARPSAIYAWTSTSPEWDVTAHSYIIFYQTQEGVTDADSHYKDREIVQVFVHPQYGNVEETVFAAGHWKARRDTEPNVYRPDGSDGRHVTLRVDQTHHHFYPTTEVGSVGADLEPLGTGETLFDGDDSKTQYEVFLENGWDPDLHPGALQNAARMRYRPYYWSDEADRWDRFVAEYGFKFRGSALGGLLSDEFDTEGYSD